MLTSSRHPLSGPRASTRRSGTARPAWGRVDGADEIVVAQGQGLSGIGLLSNPGVRFEAPETISGRARFEDVPRGGSDPDQPRRATRLDGVAGAGLSPSPGLFYFRVADPALMSAIFRAYNHHLHFCNTPEQG